MIKAGDIISHETSKDLHWVVFRVLKFKNYLKVKMMPTYRSDIHPTIGHYMLENPKYYKINNENLEGWSIVDEIPKTYD